jgi:hypothetical protein
MTRAGLDGLPARFGALRQRPEELFAAVRAAGEELEGPRFDAGAAI